MFLRVARLAGDGATFDELILYKSAFGNDGEVVGDVEIDGPGPPSFCFISVLQAVTEDAQGIAGPAIPSAIAGSNSCTRYRDRHRSNRRSQRRNTGRCVTATAREELLLIAVTTSQRRRWSRTAQANLPALSSIFGGRVTTSPDDPRSKSRISSFTIFAAAEVNAVSGIKLIPSSNREALGFSLQANRRHVGHTVNIGRRIGQRRHIGRQDRVG